MNVGPVEEAVRVDYKSVVHLRAPPLRCTHSLNISTAVSGVMTPWLSSDGVSASSGFPSASFMIAAVIRLNVNSGSMPVSRLRPSISAASDASARTLSDEPAVTGGSGMLPELVVDFGV